jgi:transcriptional regulator with PAS, ATPase and Fis domain
LPPETQLALLRVLQEREFERVGGFKPIVPPRRERKEDLPVLVEYFVDRYARKAGKQISTIDRRTMELLQAYAWPGTSASYRT